MNSEAQLVMESRFKLFTPERMVVDSSCVGMTKEYVGMTKHDGSRLQPCDSSRLQRELPSRAFATHKLNRLMTVLLLLASWASWGQQVQVTVNVLPPYSAYLQDYPGRGNQVQIFVRNTTTVPLEVRFLGQITGDNGVRIATPQNFRPLVPLRLGPMENKLLTRNDLEGLFDLGQIEVQGIDKAQLYRGLPLPEGSYQLCVRAFDNRTSRPLSADFPLGCSAPFVVRSVEPPILVNPICDSKVAPTTPQSLVFSWTPPVGVSPAQVSYTLRVLELPDVIAPANINNTTLSAPQLSNKKQAEKAVFDPKTPTTTSLPKDAKADFNTPASLVPLGFDPNVFIDAVVLPPSGVEVKNIRTNSFLYGPNQPPLKVGKRYAVRIQAIDQSRRINFLNDGKSPLCFFTYGENPFLPLQPSLLAQKEDSDKPKPIFNKIGGVVNCSCNAEEATDIQVDNSIALANKSAQIGLFTLQLLANVKEENGVLNGDGMIPIPMINSQYAKLRVRLYDVQCNAAGQVVGGVVRARLSSKADPSLFPNYDKPDYTPPSLTSDQIGNLSNFLAGQKDMLVSSLKNAKESIGFEVPFGIDKTFGPVNTVIAITNFTFTPKNAYFDANTWIKVANGQVNGIPLSGYNMCLSPDKPCGEGILYLAENMKLSQYFALKGAANVPPKGPFEGPDTNLVTHVVFDENGYKQLRVHGLMTPPGLVNAETNGPVEISVNAGMVNFQDWTAQLSFPKFYVQGLSDFKFAMLPNKPALYDHSEAKTPAKLPEGYLDATELNLWQGIYFPELSLELPAFIKREDGQPLTVGVDDMIYDNNGFSGKAFVQNILDVGKGSLDSWYYSIDELSVTFLKNTFKESGMKGKVVLPVFQNHQDQASQLPYTCTLSKDENASGLNVEFLMAPQDQMKVDIWNATLNLHQNSKILVTYNANQGFAAMAELNGNMSVTVGPMTLNAFKFEEIKLTSNAPYFSMKSLSFASPQKEAGGFPLTLTKAEPNFTKAGESIFGFTFGGKLDLTGDGPTGISGTAEATLFFKVGLTDENRPDWKYHDVAPGKIEVEGSFTFLTVKGSLEFYDQHPTYGDGLAGNINMDVKGLVSGQVQARFGRVNGFKYWQVGGTLGLGAGIQIGTTPLNFRRFGGGMFSKMKKVIGNDGTVNYLPDQSVAVGFEAKVGIGLTAPDVFEMDGTFSIALNNSYGIEATSLEADAWLLGNTAAKALAAGKASLAYNFTDQAFTGTLSFKAGFVAGPVSVVAATQESYLAINGKTGNWFLALGLPEKRVTLAVKVAGIGFDFGSYLMIGNHKPAEIGSLPPAPYKMDKSTLVALGMKDVVGEGMFSKEKTNSPVLAFGAGYNLGADFGLGPFHLRYNGGIGFDLTLEKMGECNGVTPGFNGWYAKGQVYAYLHFALDLDIDTWVYEGRLTVVELDAAALLRGGMVNPIWLNGHVLLKYRALGGLVKGKVNFEFWYNQAQKCDPKAIFAPPNPFAEQPIIAALAPSGDKKASILSPLYAEFNYPIESDIILDLEIPAGSKIETGTQGITSSGPNSSTILHREFRIQFKNNSRFQLAATKIDPEFADCNSPATGRIAWENDEDGYPNFKATYYRTHALLPRSTYELTVAVQVFIRHNGQLEPYKFKNSTVEQTEKVTFETGECLSVLTKGNSDNDNILTSYPYEGQRYFMKGDAAETFIKLKTDLSCCLKNLNSDAFYDLKVRLTPLLSGGDTPLLTDATFKGDRVTYKLPFGLKNSTLYRFELVRLPKADYADKLLAEAQKVKQDVKKIEKANLYVSANGGMTMDKWGKSDPQKAMAGAGTGNWGAGINAKAAALQTTYTELSASEYANYVTQKGQNTGIKSIVNEASEKVFSDGNFQIKKALNQTTQKQNEEAAFKKNLEVSLYRYYFKTSKFSTLKEKMAELQFPVAEQNLFSKALDIVIGKVRTSEGFDTFEVTAEHLGGDNYRPPLILLKADPTSNWFKNIAAPVAELIDFLPTAFYNEVGKGKPAKGMADVFQRSMVEINSFYATPQKPFTNEAIEKWIKP